MINVLFYIMLIVSFMNYEWCKIVDLYKNVKYQVKNLFIKTLSFLSMARPLNEPHANPQNENSTRYGVPPLVSPLLNQSRSKIEADPIDLQFIFNLTHFILKLAKLNVFKYLYAIIHFCSIAFFTGLAACSFSMKPGEKSMLFKQYSKFIIWIAILNIIKNVIFLLSTLTFGNEMPLNTIESDLLSNPVKWTSFMTIENFFFGIMFALAESQLINDLTPSSTPLPSSAPPTPSAPSLDDKNPPFPGAFAENEFDLPNISNTINVSSYFEFLSKMPKKYLASNLIALCISPLLKSGATQCLSLLLLATMSFIPGLALSKFNLSVC